MTRIVGLAGKQILDKFCRKTNFFLVVVSIMAELRDGVEDNAKGEEDLPSDSLEAGINIEDDPPSVVAPTAVPVVHVPPVDLPVITSTDRPNVSPSRLSHHPEEGAVSGAELASPELVTRYHRPPYPWGSVFKQFPSEDKSMTGRVCGAGAVVS